MLADNLKKLRWCVGAGSHARTGPLRTTVTVTVTRSHRNRDRRTVVAAGRHARAAEAGRADPQLATVEAGRRG